MPLIWASPVRGCMGRQPRLADGSFLPGLTLGGIKRMRDAEGSKRNAMKMQVAYLYKSGRTVREAADAAGTGYMNAWRWIGEMYERGPDALSHRRPPGAARWLTRDEYIQIAIDVYRGPRACGYETDAWSYVLVHKHVCKKFKVEIGYRALVRNLHELRIVIKPTQAGRHGRAPAGKRAGLRREARGAILVCTGNGGGRPPARGAGAKGKGAPDPEIRSGLPRRLANSGLPAEYLADPPEILLKE